ncbi:MAG: glycerol-3-phosphate 1-O-acyltransferase PlsY [Desulfohalobiaceae bacterium]|nr:glycerol-3-phosphate 1-O-acyltransferase PlsY [Desulfohalobiaceae bacterium]
MSTFLICLFWLALTYIIGSLPFGLIISKITTGEDPRLSGSQNTGATNIARTCGLRYGILTFLLDMAKGFIPLLLAMTLSESILFLSLTGLAAISGHMYSVFLNGTGGKGVATTIGVFAALAPTPLFWSLVICLFIIWFTGYVSVGSLALTLSLPILLILSFNLSFFLLSLAVMFLVFFKHRDNIVRLARGEENSWKFKRAA